MNTPSSFPNDSVLLTRLGFRVCKLGDMFLECNVSGVPILGPRQPWLTRATL